jgi:hypothetical protein
MSVRSLKSYRAALPATTTRNLDAGKSALVKGIGALALSLAMGNAASAAAVLDKSFGTPFPTGGEYASGHDFQQGVTVGKTGTLAYIELFLSTLSKTAETIEVRIANGTAGTVEAPGSWLYDKKISITNVTAAGWTSSSLIAPNIAVTAGEKLIIDVYDVTSYSKNMPTFGYAASTTGSYLYDRSSPGGTSYSLFGGGGYEMAFQTFVQPSAVPELSTWAMMMIGFAGLGFAGHRKARTGRTALPAA